MSRIPGAPAYVYTDMGDHISPVGGFDARYVAFLETISQLRPRLHRYCSRMTGSVLDGEDVVQDALFEAYRKLDQFDDSRSVAPWVFRIARPTRLHLTRALRAWAVHPDFQVVNLQVGGVTPWILVNRRERTL